jgi:hypothetical protein
MMLPLVEGWESLQRRCRGTRRVSANRECSGDGSYRAHSQRRGESARIRETGYRSTPVATFRVPSVVDETSAGRNGTAGSSPRRQQAGIAILQIALHLSNYHLIRKHFDGSANSARGISKMFHPRRQTSPEDLQQILLEWGPCDLPPKSVQVIL